MNKLKQIPEFLRFVMVGLFATGLHYGIYFVLQKFIQVNVAYTLGYVLSFVANFYLTAYFTFGQPQRAQVTNKAKFDNQGKIPISERYDGDDH